MKYCKPKPFNIVCISCLYPPIIDRIFSHRDFPLKIVNIVCVHAGIREYDIRGESNLTAISDARSMAIALIREYIPKMKFKAIGALFKRHYSTAIYAKNKVADLYQTDKIFKEDYDLIKIKINNYLKIANN